MLALLRCDFALHAPALDIRLGLLRLQFRFRVSLPCLGVTALCVRLGVDLRLLEATFSGQITVADERARGLLCLTGHLAYQTAGGPLRILLVGQIVLPLSNSL